MPVAGWLSGEEVYFLYFFDRAGAESTLIELLTISGGGASHSMHDDTWLQRRTDSMHRLYSSA